MTTEFLEGDLVEATSGETVVRGRITGCDSNFIGNSRRTVDTLRSNGFTLTLIERPKPKVELPTESGFYIDRAGDAWLLGSAGELQLLTNTWGTMAASESARDEYASLAAEHAPFTRLESRADTAKAVIEWMKNEYENALTFSSLLTQTREHFGVTDA